MAINLLSAIECKNATSNGASVRKLHDGDGLYLWVYLDGRKYWRMRYWQTGKEKSLSLGVYPKVSLGDARKKAEELRKQLQADLQRKTAQRLAARFPGRYPLPPQHFLVAHSGLHPKRTSIGQATGYLQVERLDAYFLLEFLEQHQGRAPIPLGPMGIGLQG